MRNSLENFQDEFFDLKKKWKKYLVDNDMSEELSYEVAE